MALVRPAASPTVGANRKMQSPFPRRKTNRVGFRVMGGLLFRVAHSEALAGSWSARAAPCTDHLSEQDPIECFMVAADVDQKKRYPCELLLWVFIKTKRFQQN